MRTVLAAFLKHEEVLAAIIHQLHNQYSNYNVAVTMIHKTV